MKKNCVMLASALLGIIFLFTRCTDDEEINLQSGTLILKITDVASDDENIKGIFITVTDLKLDGKPVRGFNPQTIEISDLTHGKTRVMLEKELAAKQYEKVTLVLAAGTGEQGNPPGCYVLTTDNSKHNLFSESGNPDVLEVTASKTFELLPARNNKLVIDFDLRKAIVRNPSADSGYRFVTPPELENAIRLIDEEASGTITGSVYAKDLERTHFYVFVYRKGEFKPSVEGTGTGKSKVLFSNSVTSSRVETDGSYFIPFVEEGDYEVRIASFRRNRDNVYTFQGFARTTSKNTGMLLDSVSVVSGSETELNIEVFSLFD